MTAATDPAWGIRGFAPEAEIHVRKLFPGGQVSQLIDALEYCIEQQIGIVNLSLGGAAPSAALERQILRARRAGVACIAAGQLPRRDRRLGRGRQRLFHGALRLRHAGSAVGHPAVLDSVRQ